MPAVIERGNLILVLSSGRFNLQERVQRQKRKRVSIQVVRKIKHLRESGSGCELFVPASVAALGPHQVIDSIVESGAGLIAAGQQGENGPCGLRRRAGRADET